MESAAKDITPPTPGSLGIKSLFHYQGFHEDHLLALIRTGRVRFSNPRDFNDPWDCRPWYAIPKTVSERKELVAEITKAHKNRFPEHTRHERRRAAKQTLGTPKLVEQEVTKLSAGIWESMQAQYRVYCLSTKSNCPLMWGHYANKHQGVCLEFACDNPIFGSAMQVAYSAVFPVYRLFGDNELVPFITKSKLWEYEDEFRVVSEERSAAKAPDTIKTDDGFLQIPEGTLRSIIIGTLAAKETIAAIKHLAAESKTPITIFSAVRVPDRYELQITPISKS